MLAKLLFFAAIVLSAGAQLTIKSPTRDTIWRHKKNVWVTWSFPASGPPPALTHIDIDLMIGPGSGMLVENISFGVPWREPGAKWKVAQTLPPGGDYFVLITSPQDRKFRVKSEPFAITGKHGFKKQNSAASAHESAGWTAVALAIAVGQLVFW